LQYEIQLIINLTDVKRVENQWPSVYSALSRAPASNIQNAKVDKVQGAKNEGYEKGAEGMAEVGDVKGNMQMVAKEDVLETRVAKEDALETRAEIDSIKSLIQQLIQQSKVPSENGDRRRHRREGTSEKGMEVIRL
jgi:hypothetical protein